VEGKEEDFFEEVKDKMEKMRIEIWGKIKGKIFMKLSE
jgi:hypothetical protein